MRAYANEKSWQYLHRALEYHREKTGEAVEAIASRAGLSAEYLAALVRTNGERIALSRIVPLCEAVPALLPHELLYVRLREQDGEGTLRLRDLTAMRREFAERRRLGALQRGENTSYREWRHRRGAAERREDDSA